MAQRKSLTEQQIDVLRWVADGCPAGVMEGVFHRISAAALRNRGLLKTSGRGPTWTAAITSAGRDYLAAVDSPNPPVPRQGNVSVTEQLINDVVAAGGVLRVPRRGWPQRDGIDYEKRARLAERLGKLPSGKRLAMAVVEDELELRLVDYPGAIPARSELAPVPVPAKVGRFHPAARAFRDRTERHEVSRAQLPRATRVIHAIATEAERRQWVATTPEESANGYGRRDWRGAKDGHLQLTVRGHTLWMRCKEGSVRTRGSWDEGVRRYRGVDRDSPWYRDRDLPSGPYDATATGRLVIELYSERSWIHRGRQSRWGDRHSWSLEDRLPHLFREIEDRVSEVERSDEAERVAAEEAAAAAVRQAQERERQWRRLMDEARQHLAHAQRANELGRQVKAWCEAGRLRHYCDAVEAAHGQEPATREWLKWARGFIADLDPLTKPPAAPPLPDPAPDALQPYLPPGWSAQGPEYG
jgi:hypothetical protein